MIIIICLLIVLIIFSGFFSSAETILYLTEEYDVVNHSKKNMNKFQKILNNNEQYLSLILFANAIVNIFIAILTTNLSNSILFNIFFTAVVLILFGEIFPKRIGLMFYKRIFPFYFSILFELNKYLKFITKLLNFFIKPFGKIKKEEGDISYDEIRTVLFDGMRNNMFSETQVLLLLRLFSFSDYKAHDLMKPYTQIDYIVPEDHPDKIKKAFKNSPDYKFPVLSDDKNKIFGYIDFRDILHFYEQFDDDNDNYNILNFIQKPTIVYEEERFSTIIKKMVEKKEDYIFVVDEYFQFQGIIEFSFIVNYSLTTDIDKIAMIGKDVIVSGEISLDDLKYIYSIFLPDKFNNLNNFLHNLKKDIPRKNEILNYKNYRFKILNMEGNNITRVRISKV